jgi:phospholipase C
MSLPLLSGRRHSIVWCSLAATVMALTGSPPAASQADSARTRDRSVPRTTKGSAGTVGLDSGSGSAKPNDLQSFIQHIVFIIKENRWFDQGVRYLSGGRRCHERNDLNRTGHFPGPYGGARHVP